MWKCRINIFLYTMGICAALILIKNQYSSKLLQHATYGMPALIEMGNVQNLYIGSSMFRQGLDIHVLEEENEEENYILAYNGNQPVFEYLQLKKLLENDVKIKNLYIDMYVYSAWSEPKISDEKLLLETNMNDKIRLWKLLSFSGKGNAEVFWKIFVNGNDELLLFWPINDVLINEHFYRGGSTSRPVASSEEKLSQLSTPELEGNMNEIQKEAIKSLIELAQGHKINITFVETPKYKTVVNNLHYLAAMQEYVNYLSDYNVTCVLSEQTLSQIPVVNDVTEYAYDHSNADYFQDLIHLSYEGRCEFTRRLKQEGGFEKSK